MLEAGHAGDDEVTTHRGRLVWRDAEGARIVGLGAVRLYDGRLGPQTWVTLADPEGIELCVS